MVISQNKNVFLAPARVKQYQNFINTIFFGKQHCAKLEEPVSSRQRDNPCFVLDLKIAARELNRLNPLWIL